MKTLKLIAILTLLSQTLFSQAPPPPPPPPPPPLAGQVSKGDSLFNEGNIKEAVAEYKKMYNLKPGDGKNIYNYACALSRNGQIDSAFKYLNIYVNIEPGTRALTDPDLIALREDKRWAGFEEKLIALINARSGNPIKDVDYAKALWRLLCMDQYCFYENAIAVKNLGPRSPVVLALRRLQNMQNQKNLEELELLLQEKGWPKRSQVGPAAAGAAFFVIQHSSGEAQQKYISMFEIRCRENEADCNQYALMFDRMRMNLNLPQRFGTHHYLDPAAGKTDELYPLEDETKVDEWRKEIGLEPLRDYLKRANIKYKPNTPDGSTINFKLVNNKTQFNAKIENSRLVRIVLDSGMGWDGLVITNPDLIDSIALINPIEATLGGAGNSGQSNAVFADSMKFTAGEVEFSNQRIVILSSGGFKGASFDGVTGYSIFGHYVVEINYDNFNIILHKPGEYKIDKSWVEIPLNFRENMIPWMDARIVIENEEPITVSCYIDYASSEAIELLIKSDQKFTFPEKTETYYLGRGLSGDINGKKGKISKVIIGPYELTDVVAAFAPAEVRSKQRGADGVIANNLLSRFNLIFDYSEKKLFIKPNSHFSDPFI